MGYQPIILSGFTVGGSSGGGGGGGTVTSVGLVLPTSVFTVTNSPVVGSGNLTGSFNTQAANTVFAGPASGAAAAPTFRALVASDFSGTFVGSVTATSPLFSSGGSTPNLTIQQSSTSQSGYLSSTDWNTFNGKGSGTVTAISVATANGLTGISSGGATPVLTLSTSISGLLKGNGSAISAAVAGTDYVIPSGSITGTASNVTATSNSTLVTLSSLSLPYSQITGAPSSPVFNKENITLSSTDITNQFATLAFIVTANSLTLAVDKAYQVEGDDYILSTVAGFTRLTFNNALATGGVSALVSGDILNLQYTH